MKLPLQTTLLAAITLWLAADFLGAQQPDSTRRLPASDSSSVRRLPPVTISGARLSTLMDRRLPATVDAVSTGNATPGPSAMADALTRLPGVSMSNDQGSRAQPTLELRGFSLSPVVGVPQGVSVFLDGVRINEPDAQELNFDLIPMEAITRAELIRGPSAMFGKNTLAGALNLTTDRGGATPHAELSSEAGSFGYLSESVSASGSDHGVDAYLLARAATERGYQANSGSTTRQLFSTVGRKTIRNDLAASLLYARDRASEAGSLPESWLALDRRANYTAGDYFKPELLQIGVRGADSIGRAQLRGNVFARRNVTEQFNANVQDADSRAFITNRSLGATAELTLPTRVAHIPIGMSIGAEASRNSVRYRVLAQPNAQVTQLPAECEPVSGLCEDARSNGGDAGVYAELLAQLNGRLALLASGRADYVTVPFRDLRDPANNGDNTFVHFSPQVGLTYTPDERLTVHVSTGSGFRAPAALELACASPSAPCPLPFSLGADPPLRPVAVWSTEVGGTWNDHAGNILRAAAFQTTVHDEIAFVSSRSAAGFFQNVPRTRRDGIELSAEMPAATNFQTFASYAFLRAVYRSTVTLASALDGNVVTSGDQFPLTPRHVVNAGVRGTLPLRSTLLQAELSVHAVSSQFLRGDDANRTRPLSGYSVGALRVSAESAHFTLDLHVDNILDRRYNVFGVYSEDAKAFPGMPPILEPSVERFLTPAYPRTVTAGLTVRR